MMRRTLLASGLLLILQAVPGLPLASPAPVTAQAHEDEDLIPPGHGTLRQDRITVQLRRDDLLIKVTPLRESIIRLLAPDTYDRLAAIKLTHGEALKDQIFEENPLFVLVQLFSNEPNVTYQPEDILLVNQGLKYRPLGIQPITPGWGTQRLSQQQTQLAVYAFDPEIDLEVDLAVEYKEVFVSGWDRVLPELQAEEAKIRARAGRTPGG